MSDHSYPRIIFLHIPKTAGQSVHHFLEFFVPPEKVSPARVNSQLVTMSISEMRQYQLFSGHLDWSLLDCLDGPKFTFSVLREPVSRIVSFYLYLLREAKGLSSDQLRLPQNAGPRAILELSCDQYFSAGPPDMRIFLDNHYNNFYAYYFAGRRFDGRQKLTLNQKFNKDLTDEKIVDMACENIRVLDAIYSVSELHHLESDIRTLTGINSPAPTFDKLKINTGDSNNIEGRMAELARLGATQVTFNKLKEMTILDQQIWEKFGDQSES
ncbi:MAG TPA: sulfotransferase family 2 domain-containing protein [Acidocella sp.]|uniref:sulfotransferase family 2 domain-containing protein n=1 Tax=Acidocella sp. TaxID=50710 RepID=UPI002BFEDCBC|nr:sulfotransferase family 2 domain-containing protein [Acidocella sp.]HVE23405.1 sulfotransferase family 2 domain-containing protein [Acidocella sp.]